MESYGIIVASSHKKLTKAVYMQMSAKVGRQPFGSLVVKGWLFKTYYQAMVRIED